jgi:hypothetical protein
MSDIKNQNVIWAKGMLFLFLGLLTSILLVLEAPSLKTVLLLLVLIWAFCRFYYFVFYVIEHYVDSGYRFSGLISFFQYLLRRRSGGI